MCNMNGSSTDGSDTVVSDQQSKLTTHVTLKSSMCVQTLVTHATWLHGPFGCCYEVLHCYIDVDITCLFCKEWYSLLADHSLLCCWAPHSTQLTRTNAQGVGMCLNRALVVEAGTRVQCRYQYYTCVRISGVCTIGAAQATRQSEFVGVQQEFQLVQDSSLSQGVDYLSLHQHGHWNFQLTPFLFCPLLFRYVATNLCKVILQACQSSICASVVFRSFWSWWLIVLQDSLVKDDLFLWFDIMVLFMAYTGQFGLASDIHIIWFCKMLLLSSNYTLNRLFHCNLRIHCTALVNQNTRLDPQNTVSVP